MDDEIERPSYAVIEPEHFLFFTMKIRKDYASAF